MHITPGRMPVDAEDGDFVTLSEVAEIVRTPINTLRWKRQIGEGPPFFKIGRRLFTTVGELRDWIEEQRRGGRPDVA